ncbi:MAG: hypothetical protein ACRD35_06460 [Candidatus Acidiferrales bacterium]
MSLSSVSPPERVRLGGAHLDRVLRLVAARFEFVRFRFLEAFVGVKKYGCAALLAPVPEGTFTLAAPPAYLIEGNMSALVERGGAKWFVWKSNQVPATEPLLEDLRRFETELRGYLEAPSRV